MPSDKRSSKRQNPNLDNLGLEVGNKPPQALDVEESVLGAMMLEPSSVDQAMEDLSSESFYDPRHKMVFEAMMELVRKGDKKSEDALVVLVYGHFAAFVRFVERAGPFDPFVLPFR